MNNINTGTRRQPIKVLMVLPNLRPSNGVTNFIMYYFRGISHDEIHIDFATLSYRESPFISEVKCAGSEVFILPSIVKNPIKHFKKCRRILQNGNYDIIHDNTLLQSLPIMWLSKKYINTRVFHSHSPRLGEKWYKALLNALFFPQLLKSANHFAACSESAGKAIFGSRAFYVIPNVIDTDRFVFDEQKRRSIRARENSDKVKIIGTVGRLAVPKNPFFAIDVIEEVLKKRQDAEYWWIGSGPLDEQVKQYVESRHLEDRIKLKGSRIDMPDLYQAMDVFFLPSKFEGFGIACVEAEAAGLPCVVSDRLPKEVDITSNVIFVSLDQSAGFWADKIIACMEKRPNRTDGNRLCKNSRYSLYNSGDALRSVYESCLRN